MTIVLTTISYAWLENANRLKESGTLTNVYNSVKDSYLFDISQLL